MAKKAPINRRSVTHIKPNEAQGVAKAPTASKAQTGEGFYIGAHSMVKAGVEDIPGVSHNASCCDECQGFTGGYTKPGHV